MKKYSLLIALLFFKYILFAQSNSQNHYINAITTAVPFLLMDDNAETFSLGNIGVVASDENYQGAYMYNPALAARNKKIKTAYISYIPWLRQLVPDINLFSGGFIYSDGNNGFAGSLKYFNGGEITYTNSRGVAIDVIRPVEYAASAKYARSFFNSFSLGIGGKYIYSNLGLISMTSWAGDFGLNYRHNYSLSANEVVKTSIGLSLLNLGPKVFYIPGYRKDFIPSNLLFGIMSGIEQQNENLNTFSLNIAYQAQKLLIPSPAHYDGSGNIIAGMDPDVDVLTGIIQSFYDAPLGAEEELNEINHQLGLEVRHDWNKSGFSVAFRTGYFHEHKTKGNRKFLTIGTGFEYRVFNLNLVYLIPLVQRHSFSNTIAITVGVRF